MNSALLAAALTPVDHHQYLVQARDMQAMSFAVHIPLVCFGIAFPALVLYVEWLHMRTGDEVFGQIARRWSRVMVALFAAGVITGTILSFDMGNDTLVVVIAAVLIGALLLFPSLGLLFVLHLRGRFDPHATHGAPPMQPRSLLLASSSGLLTRSAGACAIAGFGFLTVASAGWMHAVGVVCFFAFVVLGFLAVGPAQLAAE